MVGHARHHGQVGAGAEGEDQMIVMDLPRAAQRIADHWNISRQDMEAYALESHRRALAAMAAGRFVNEIVPCEGLRDDETPRQTSLAKMAELEPVSAEFPSITAAVSFSQTS